MAAEKIKDNGRLPRCAAAPLAMTDGEIAALRCRSVRNDGWGDYRAALPHRSQ